MKQELLDKLVTAARNYYVLNLPTGMLDREYDQLEAEARQEGFEVRDFVYKEIQGTRVQNADYLTKVKKSQVGGSMREAVEEFSNEFFNKNGYYPYWIPKYDGSSLIGYYNSRGDCFRVVTVGGNNLTSEGIDQTSKFKKYFPTLKNSGVKALQCECLVKLEHGFSEKSRQKANGLVNSKFLESEISLYCNLRCFRYFLENGYSYDYLSFISNLPTATNMTGDIKFSGGLVVTTQQLLSFNGIENDIWETPTGTFLVDGIVAYTKEGECIQALKYKDAGRGEVTKVSDIQWNDNSKKGKDSWSANAIIDPIEVRGSRITKPSVGSVSKMVETKLSPGALVTVILANSTIPQVKDVLQEGNGNFNWPTCSCGYKMSEKDIFGSLLKCGNPRCTNRYNNMLAYLKTINDWEDIDLNKLLVLDRFDWSKYDQKAILGNLKVAFDNNDFGLFTESLKIKKVKKEVPVDKKDPSKGMTKIYVDILSDLQLKNLQLVIEPAWAALKNWK